VYANSEDGYIYAIAQGGASVQRIFQEQTVGAAYTPLAIDSLGRILTMNNGTLTVIGN
jgi:hypothetical protein